MNKTKEIVFNIAIVFFVIIIFIICVFFMLKYKANEEIKFEADLNICVENSQLTEYEQDKLEILVITYMQRDHTLIRSCSIDSFNNWLKYNDYDFWYDINYIFE